MLGKRIVPFDSGRVAARGTFWDSVGGIECPQIARIIMHTAGVLDLEKSSLHSGPVARMQRRGGSRIAIFDHRNNAVFQRVVGVVTVSIIAWTLIRPAEGR